MKTLVFNGSPHPHGDTASLLAKLSALLPGEITEIRAYDAPISPCIDCRACRTSAGCVIEDAMQKVYDEIQDCDNIVIASPLYFSELTGKLLDLASRLQTYFSARYFRGEEPIAKTKKGAVILVGGGDGKPERAFLTAQSLLHHMRCTKIHPLVVSHQTDRIAAADDPQAISGIEQIADFSKKTEKRDI